MKRVILMFMVCLCFILILTACDSDGGDDDTDSNTDSTDTSTQEAETADSGAVDAVLNYLQAKVDGDEEGITNLICSAMEADIQREATSLASVSPTLSEDVACAVSGEADGYTLVTCDGAIIALYGTETRELPLGTYRTLQEDGEWRWCGEG